MTHWSELAPPASEMGATEESVVQTLLKSLVTVMEVAGGQQKKDRGKIMQALKSGIIR